MSGEGVVQYADDSVVSVECDTGRCRQCPEVDYHRGDQDAGPDGPPLLYSSSAGYRYCEHGCDGHSKPSGDPRRLAELMRETIAAYWLATRDDDDGGADAGRTLADTADELADQIEALDRDARRAGELAAARDLFLRIREQVQQDDGMGSWPGGDVVELLTRWFPWYGLDPDTPLRPEGDDDEYPPQIDPRET